VKEAFVTARNGYDRHTLTVLQRRRGGGGGGGAQEDFVHDHHVHLQVGLQREALGALQALELRRHAALVLQVLLQVVLAPQALVAPAAVFRAVHRVVAGPRRRVTC